MITNNKSYSKKIVYRDKIKVSFILPYFAQYGKTLDVIENINKMFYALDKEIIIVDDGSTNKDFYLKLIQKNAYIVVRHEEQKGFGASINSGLKQVKNKYAIVCHNDIKFFDQNCCMNLIKNMYKLEKENVAILSSVTNNPLVDFDELKKNNASDTEAYVTTLPYLPMYCCCVNVRGLLSIGGVPEHPYAWFEDVVLAKKLKEKNYNLGICPSSYVFHEGMGTIKDLINNNTNILKIMKSNSSFVKK